VAGGYAFRAGQALPPLLLDDEEALAVSIALRTATAGLHRVAQLTQTVDVAPQRARVHFQPLGQLGAYPVAAGLQQ